VQGEDARAGLRREIKELAVTAVPIEQPGLFVLLRRVPRVNFGIDVPIDDDQVFPPVIVDVYKRGAPP